MDTGAFSRSRHRRVEATYVCCSSTLGGHGEGVGAGRCLLGSVRDIILSLYIQLDAQDASYALRHSVSCVVLICLEPVSGTQLFVLDHTHS